MNERIKKLKEQATSYTWNGNDVTEELDEQKFAELIVQECVNALQNNHLWNSDISRALTEHFGVK